MDDEVGGIDNKNDDDADGDDEFSTILCVRICGRWPISTCLASHMLEGLRL